MVSRLRQQSRLTKTAILIVGEGPTEKALLLYLKEMYIKRDMGVAVKVECGSGGSPKSVVEKAIRLKASRAYDRCYVLVDADMPHEFDRELQTRMHKRPCIQMLSATPCIEGLLLAILDTGFSQQAATSSESKRIFETKYLPADKKTDRCSYGRILPKQIIEKHRTRIAELHAILTSMGI